MWFTLLVLQYDIFVLIFFGTAYTRLRKNNDKNHLTETEYKIVCKGIKPPLIYLFHQENRKGDSLKHVQTYMEFVQLSSVQIGDLYSSTQPEIS